MDLYAKSVSYSPPLSYNFVSEKHAQSKARVHDLGCSLHSSRIAAMKKRQSQACRSHSTHVPPIVTMRYDLGHENPHCIFTVPSSWSRFRRKRLITKLLPPTRLQVPCIAFKSGLQSRSLKVEMRWVSIVRTTLKRTAASSGRSAPLAMLCLPYLSFLTRVVCVLFPAPPSSSKASHSSWVAT